MAKTDSRSINYKNFASDNNAAVHPQVIRAIVEANQGLRPAYGADYYTHSAEQAFQKLFRKPIEAYFVFNGTAANVLGLESCLQAYEAAICSDIAHINQDECGAPERITGSKLLSVPSVGGKIDIDSVEKLLKGYGDQHVVQPRVISISQSTEYGTLYSIEEMKELSRLIHRHGGYLHVDGARIANAVVGLQTTAHDLLEKTQVDVLTFGGTKNGILLGEAVLFLNRALARNFRFRRKQAMQLSSKMRYISCQFLALLEKDLWLKNAEHANRTAKYLEKLIKEKTDLSITQPVQANAVFALVPHKVIERLQKHYYFYVWNPQPEVPPTRLSKSSRNQKFQEVRWMTSFNTRPSEVKQFVSELARHCPKL